MALKNTDRVVLQRFVLRESMTLEGLEQLYEAIDAAIPKVTARTVTIHFEVGGSVQNAPGFAEALEEAAAILESHRPYSAALQWTGQAEGKNTAIQIAFNRSQQMLQLVVNPHEEVWAEVVDAFEEAVGSVFQPLDAPPDFAKLVKRYQDALAQLDDVESSVTAATQFAHDASELAKQAKDDAQVISEQRATCAQAASEVADSRKAVQQAESAIADSRQQAENSRMTLKAYVDNVAKFEKRMTSAEEKALQTAAESDAKAKELVSSTRDSAARVMDELRSEHKVIVDSLKEQDAEVKRILQGAVAGALFRVFEDKRKARARQSWFWWAACVLTGVAIGGIPLAVLYGVTIDDAGFDVATIVKLATTLPLIGLEFFFIREYSTVRRLVAAYEFKSAIALSLKAYEEMLSEDGRRDDVQEFLTEAIREIYTPPEDTRPRPPRSLRQIRSVVDMLKEAGMIDAARRGVGLPDLDDKS